MGITSANKILEALTLYSETQNAAEVARRLGLARSTVKDWIAAQRDGTLKVEKQGVRYGEKFVAFEAGSDGEIGEQVVRDENVEKGEMKLFVLSARISTVEEALQAAEVNPDEWEAYRCVVKTYEQACKVQTTDENGRKKTIGTAVTPMKGIQVWLKRKNNVVKEVYADLLEDMKRHAPVYPKYPKSRVQKSTDRIMIEYSFPDLHLGGLSYPPECFGDDYSCEIAIRRCEEVLTKLLSHTSHYVPEKILYVMGSDLLNAGFSGETHAGTRQDCDTRFTRMFRIARELTVSTIDRLAEIAPVEVLVIPGNHDTEQAFTLGEAISCWYHATDRVRVDNSPAPRKVCEHGQNIIMVLHGSETEPRQDKLPMILATEHPEAWARCKFREIHMGHFHRASETKYKTLDQYNSTTVRILPSLSSQNAWSAKKGFTGTPKAAEAHVYSATEGHIAVFTAHPSDYLNGGI